MKTYPLILFVTLAFSSVYAAPIASDSFANTAGGADYNIGSLRDQTATVGTTGYVAGNSWIWGTGAIYNTSGGLTHTMTPGTALEGRIVAFSGTGTAGRAQIRQLDYSPATGSYYFSALFQKNPATTTQDLLAGVTGAIAGSNGAYTLGSDFMMGIYNGGFSVAVPGSGFTELVTAANLVVGETYFGLMEIDFNTTGDDSAKVSIYNASSVLVASQTFTGLNLSLDYFAAATNNYGPNVSADEFRYGTELSDVQILGAPTVSDIEDNQPSNAVPPGTLLTYTVKFSQDMDGATVTAADFGNAATIANYTIGTVTESSPGVFSVPVTPNESGSLQLQINQDAILSDTFGNDLDTTSAIFDDTTITVEVDTTDPTIASGGIVDNQSGGPVEQGTTVTYTITFSEYIDETTVDSGDFDNHGSATFTIDSINEVSPGVFEVEVTPTSTGTLQLKVISGAEISDGVGNLLDTSSDIISDAVNTVVESSTAAVKLLRVVFVAGQSNADGRAATSGLPTSPVNLQLPQEDVDFFYRVESTIFPLTTLRPGLSETSGFGPAITCGRHLADELADGITTRGAVIKYANGGTNLYSQWVGGGDATTTGDGSQYVRFQETVTAGLAALASTYPNATVELVGMVWLQGESDSGGQAVNYQTNLTNFIADLRLTYGADLRFVVIRLSDGQTAVGSLATIRAAQTAVAAADPLTGLVDSDGFGMKTDNLHFDAVGQQQNGHAAALQLLNLYPFLSAPQITPQQAGDYAITLNDSFEGFVYTLESSDTLQSEDWVPGEAQTATGATLDFTVTPPAGANRYFYRLGRSLAP